MRLSEWSGERSVHVYRILPAYKKLLKPRDVQDMSGSLQVCQNVETTAEKGEGQEVPQSVFENSFDWHGNLTRSHGSNFAVGIFVSFQRRRFA